MRGCGWPGYPLLYGVLTYAIHDSLIFFSGFFLEAETFKCSALDQTVIIFPT